MLVKLHNEGAEKVPDSYGREGLNYFLLKPGQWNRVVWEIPHLARDKVTAVDFIYRLQGNEPDAASAVQFDIDQLELQRVETDQFEGWSVAPGHIISSSGTGTSTQPMLRSTGFRQWPARLSVFGFFLDAFFDLRSNRRMPWQPRLEVA